MIGSPKKCSSRPPVFQRVLLRGFNEIGWSRKNGTTRFISCFKGVHRGRFGDILGHLAFMLTGVEAGVTHIVLDELFLTANVP